MAPTPILVNDTNSLAACLRELNEKPDTPLAIDAEGNNLSRIGTLSTLQIYPKDGDKVYIVDFTTRASVRLLRSMEKKMSSLCETSSKDRVER